MLFGSIKNNFIEKNAAAAATFCEVFMRCFNCGTENPENAVYCKHCGKRLDNLKVCAFCGGLTPADGEYCINCGAEISAPVEPVRLQTPLKEGAGGPLCGAAERSFSAGAAQNVAAFCGGTERGFASVNAKAQGAPEEKVAHKKSFGVLHLLAFLFASFASLFGFAFVFAIGCSPYIFGSGDQAQINSEGAYIYYFFCNAYKDSLSINDDNYSGALFGTLFALLGMGGTVAGFVLSAIRFKKILAGKTEKTMVLPATATVVSYICSVCFFILCFAQRIDRPDMTGFIGPNAATISGIVLSAAFLVAAVVLSSVARGTNKKAKFYIFHSVFRGAYAALLFTVLGLIGCGFIFFAVNASSDSTASYGLLTLLNSVALGGASDYMRDLYNTCSALAGVAVAAAAVLGVFSVFITSDYASAIGEEAKSKIFIFMIAASACTVAIGAMMLSASLVWVARFEITYSANVAVPIAVIVLGALMLASVIVYRTLSKKFNCGQSETDFS